MYCMRLLALAEFFLLVSMVFFEIEFYPNNLELSPIFHVLQKTSRRIKWATILCETDKKSLWAYDRIEGRIKPLQALIVVLIHLARTAQFDCSGKILQHFFVGKKVLLALTVFVIIISLKRGFFFPIHLYTQVSHNQSSTSSPASQSE